MARAFAEIAFTPTVRAEQERHGSARTYGRFLAPEADAANRLGPRETTFIAARDSFFQATVSSTGWPYVQHRGGPEGFVKVLDDRRIAYADLGGNRQYVSVGNIADDARVSLILVDYPNQVRLKIWGRAEIIDGSDDPGLIATLVDGDLRGRPERAVIITIDALDWNCPKYIPQRLTVAEFDQVLAPLKAKLKRLEQENRTLRQIVAGTADQ